MRRGFTLIELLVVITILAILSGAALPYVQSYVAESRIAKAKTDLEEISRALAVYETREGDYAKSTVADLTGRYLNKAPIDPWGKSYYIATAAGQVVSGGPDRNTSTDEDNIISPYQPPLALVQVKWVDRNQSGAVDAQNASDQVQLQFSRRLKNDINAIGSHLDDWFHVSSGTAMTDFFSDAPANMVSLSSKTIVLQVLQSASASIMFTPGSDTVTIVSGHGNTAGGLLDMNDGLALASQDVIILPQ